jgi:hypothetical protein
MLSTSALEIQRC